MPGWTCTIGGCDATYGDVEEVIAHQANTHPHHECAVCGTVVPDGVLAIHHVFEEHSRAEYVRAYDAAAADIRARENVKRAVSRSVDVAALRRRLDASPVPSDD